MRNPLRLTPEALAIQERVTGPIGKREYVSYNRDFLERYIPNETYYLSQSLRADLLKRGRLRKKIINLEEQFILDLSWNSSRLEGNHYSYDEAKRVLAGEIEGEDEDTQMLLNHQEALHFLYEEREREELCPEMIYKLHAILSQGLLGNASASGSIRSIPINITGSVYFPLSIPAVLEECLHEIITTAQAIEDPYEQAFFLMVHLPYLQAFEDVNKRTSRLAMNIPFIQQNLCPFSFIDIPFKEYAEGLLGVYELNDPTLLKEVFAWGYTCSCKRYGVGVEVATPSIFHLQYRQLTKEVIQAIVKERRSVEEVLKEKEGSLPEDEREDYALFIKEEVEGLHPNNAIRYGITPEDFEAWAAHKGSISPS